VAVPLLAVVHDWYCPNCGLTDQTREALPHSRYHTCPKLRFLSAPMLPVGTKAKVELNERADYVNGDNVQLDPELGRPVMSIVTTRDNGTDALVFAPCATVKIGA